MSTSTKLTSSTPGLVVSGVTAARMMVPAANIGASQPRKKHDQRRNPNHSGDRSGVSPSSAGGNSSDGEDSGSEASRDARRKKLGHPTQQIGSEMALSDGIPATESVRGNLGKYLANKIRRYMHKKKMCRADACRSALNKAICKKYPIMDGDAGYGLRVAHAALDESCTITVRAVDASSRSPPIAFSSLSRTRSGDDELRVGFQSTGPRKGLASARGIIRLSIEGSTPSDIAYDFDSSMASRTSEYHLCRLPLYRDAKIEKTVHLELPVCELHATVKLVSLQGGVAAKIRKLEMVVFLRPSGPWLLDPRPAIPCIHKRSPISVSPLAVTYSTEEERRASECVSRPPALTEVIDRALRNRLGSGDDHVYRLVAHSGRQVVCQAGASGEQLFYRLGSVTEVMTSVAVCAYVQETAPTSLKCIDLHDSSLLEHFLRESGALRVLKGLKKAFSAIGSGRIPSIFELLNHQSGLPEHFPLDCTTALDRLIASGTIDTLAESCDSRMPEVERALGKKLSKHVMPLFEPGTKVHHSHVGYAILRFVFPDWRVSGHSCEYLSRCSAELGMPSAVLGVSANGRHAPTCPSTCELLSQQHHDEPGSPYYLLSTGASGRIEELADMLAGSGQARHCWTAQTNTSSNKYSFLPHMLVPRAVVSREAGIYTGYGWQHMGLKIKGFGRGGLRALVSIGYTPGHHSVVACMIPALSISFALGTNADLAFLLDKKSRSIEQLLTQIVSAIVHHVAPLENCRMKRATIFNPTLNQQLCMAPQPGAMFSRHVRYCQSKEAFFEEKDPGLDSFCAADSFVSLGDMRHSIASAHAGSGRELTAESFRSPVSISLRYERIAIDAKGDVTRGIYVLTEKYAHGDSASYAIAYDPDAFRSNKAARRSLAESARGAALDKRECGMYRIVDPTDGLLSEYVTFGMAAVRVRNVASGGADSQAQEPVISFRGRAYVRRALYDVARTSLAPTVSDRVATKLAGLTAHSDQLKKQQQQQKKNGGGSFESASDEFDEDASLLYSQSSIGSSIRPSQMALTASGALSSPPSAPNTAQVAHRRGRGRSRFWSNFGAGAAAGAGFAVGALASPLFLAPVAASAYYYGPYSVWTQSPCGPLPPGYVCTPGGMRPAY